MVDCTNDIIPNRPHYGMFNAVARRYDLVNHALTWGLDKRWRRKAAQECVTSQPNKMLDLCCGTGDLALNIARLSNNNVGVTGLDYSQPMLDRATKKAEPLAKKVSFIHGDAANLPFPDGYFDCIGISFAFRNLTYRNPMAQRNLAEALRVLRPSGKFVILETSQPEVKLIRKLYHLYLHWFVSKVGSLLSGNRGAFHYLAESAARFYTSQEIAEMLVTAGFRQVSFRRLFLGVAGIHIAVK